MSGHIKHWHLFQSLIRTKCPEPIYYWLLDRLTDNNGWRPLSTREPRRIKVTREQVQAARIHVQAYRSAGLTPDPMIVKLAEAEGHEK